MKSKIYLNRSSFSRQASAILAASAALAFASAQAGTLVFSSAVPTFDGDDITQLGFGPGADGLNLATDASDNDNARYIAHDRPAQGQTFTVTTAGNIQSLTLKNIFGFFIADSTPITVRLNTITGGTNLALVASETVIVGTQSRAAGDYFTFSFTSPVAVSPGLYGFDFGATGSGNYFAIDGALQASYAGGSAYSSGPITGGKGNGVGDATATLRDTDRTFGVAFTAIPEPSSFALVLVGSLGLVGMRRRQ